MSFLRLGVDGIQEVLILALMIVFLFVVIFSNMSLMYKIGIGALVFSIIFITSLASQALKQEKEEDRIRNN